MKKILVTGGFGFIGSTLVEILAKDKKNKVHVIDDMLTSPIDIEDYLEAIGKPKNLTYEITTVEEFFTKKKIGRWDEIYHLASPVGPAGVLKHAGRMIRVVVRDGYLIMDYCLKERAKFLDVSTSELYGGGQDGYCDETMPKIISATTTVRLEYAVAKLAVETAIINTVKKKAESCHREAFQRGREKAINGWRFCFAALYPAGPSGKTHHRFFRRGRYSDIHEREGYRLRNDSHHGKGEIWRSL